MQETLKALKEHDAVSNANLDEGSIGTPPATRTLPLLPYPKTPTLLLALTPILPLLPLSPTLLLALTLPPYP